MHEFLLFKANFLEQNKEAREDSTSEPNTVNMFYLGGGTTTGAQVESPGVPQNRHNDSIEKQRQRNVSNSPQRNGQPSPDLHESTMEARRESNPDVNEIIVKIEMKKFQNLIENRIKHKNNLLQSDMKRVYPLTKK